MTGKKALPPGCLFSSIVEERMLEDKFGEAWVAYKEKLRRWI
jgi:protein-S-isoprenylcysteine O-methyltransferase Ste14